jgi:hypothetical protein
MILRYGATLNSPVTWRDWSSVTSEFLFFFPLKRYLKGGTPLPLDHTHCPVIWLLTHKQDRGRCGRDRMVVGFTTTYAISAYHHWCFEFESRSGRGAQHYVIKFVSDLLQVDGFLQVLWFPPPIKLTATI